MVGVCPRPPNQDEKAGEMLYKQRGEVSRSEPLSSWGTASYQVPAGNAISREGTVWELLECVGETFPTELVRHPAREGPHGTCCLQTEKDWWVT